MGLRAEIRSVVLRQGEENRPAIRIEGEHATHFECPWCGHLFGPQIVGETCMGCEAVVVSVDSSAREV